MKLTKDLLQFTFRETRVLEFDVLSKKRFDFWMQCQEKNILERAVNVQS